MTPRITGHDIRTFAVTQKPYKPEPFFTELGYGPYYDVIARLVNQVTATEEKRAAARDRRALASAQSLGAIVEGIMTSLGEVLTDRSRVSPISMNGPEEMTHDQWVELVIFRAAGYLRWLQPLLDQKREEIR